MGQNKDDILGALEIEWMKREADRMDRQVRDMLKSSENYVKEETNDTRR